MPASASRRAAARASGTSSHTRGDGQGGGRCPSPSSRRRRTPGVSPPTFSSAIPASSNRSPTVNPARS